MSGDRTRFWSPAVRGLHAYTPGEQPQGGGWIKLNTNENPYPPSPLALQRMADAVDDRLRLYPDPQAIALRQTIAAQHGLQIDQVFVGNGSDEVLAHAFMGLLRHGLPLLVPDISYSFYPVYCGLYGITCQPVPLDDGYRVRVADYLQPNSGIVLPNPNAPTGIALPLSELRWLLERNSASVVVVDEAYVDFGAESAATLIGEFPQLLVIQTLSKSRALAGLRVGFALGHADLIQALTTVKDSFNSYPLDRVALAGAQAALDDQAHFAEITRRIVDSRTWLVAQLAALGFECLPSSANFVLARHPQHRGAPLQQALRERKILVRHFNQARIADHLRITIGSQAECEALVHALSELLAPLQNHIKVASA
ncbi:histidinol-phosphate transaminase [Hydrogenophaga sp. BPS33]|uniref:histidinol-phosphate transaminase n=1 Tax=Hydrogenophaga sp. BPS33 TaxID=2651974 RepID=UPI00131F6407|nr:histidinol-phosphate transaminase [Hydrogenophaga sp. BPS33]QHE87720.1 histidinol-phosphate transaminase [Hydrogenophaga sp. BPS33]